MSKELNFFKETITDIFGQIANEDSIKEAAELMAETIIKDDVIHVIGPGGHSNMAVEEMFWRAGGLVPINGILDPGTNLIHGAKRSNIIERTPGYGIRVMDAYGIGQKEGELIIIVNAYGINSMTVDIALEAKKRNMKTIAVTSKSFAQNVPKDHPARHPSGLNLYEIVDVFVDCHMPLGDAVVEIEGFEQKVGSSASLCNIFAVDCLVVETVKKLVEKGVNPPVWVSANMPGGDEANKANEEKYFGRIKHLR